MASTLLKCSICPKQPSFSDISHLLTHISSKGHLAHLHKLQVRSHQEVTSGQQLATYDLWYQQHGLGQLLSERLQQKDAKRASSRNKRAKPTPKKMRKFAATADSRSASMAPEPSTRTALRSRNNASFELQYPPFGPSFWGDGATQQPYNSEEDDNLDSSPSPSFRRLHGTNIASPTIKRSPSDLADSFDLAEEDDENETSRLKGLIWPGMDIFDAATEEMRRKRNQKKDGTLLKQMERCSERIEATEIIYSPSGIMRKQRPITGNVEDTSPLKGETPVPKKRAVRPKRPALTEINPNLPIPKRRSTRTAAVQRGVPKQRAPTNPYVTNTGGLASYKRGSAYSPAEDTKNELSLTLGYSVANTRKRSLSVFNDDRFKQDISQPSSIAATSAAATYNYYGYGGAEPPTSNGPSYPTQQSGLQYSLYSWDQPQNRSLQRVDSEKDNIDPALASTIGPTSVHSNPLGWTGQRVEPHPTHLGPGREEGHWMNPPMHGLPSDTVGYSVNPLSFAFQQLQGHAENPFVNVRHDLGDMPDNKECLGSPYGALSDMEGTELPKGFFGDERD